MITLPVVQEAPVTHIVGAFLCQKSKTRREDLTELPEIGQKIAPEDFFVNAADADAPEEGTTA